MSDLDKIADPMDPEQLRESERKRAFEALDTSGKHAFLIAEGHNLSANERLRIIHGNFFLPSAPRILPKPTEKDKPMGTPLHFPSGEQEFSILSAPVPRRVRNVIHRSSYSGLPPIIREGSYTMGQAVTISNGRAGLPDAITRIEDAPSRARASDSSRKNA